MIESKQAGRLAMGFLLSACCGCGTLDVLDEPDEIPRAVGSYESAELQVKAGKLILRLDTDDCVEAAMFVSKGAFGGSSIDAQFPVKPVIRREFERMLAENFAATSTSQAADLYLKVATQRVLLTERMSKVTADISINVKLLHPDGTRLPLLRKTYRAQTYGKMSDDDEIPICFYQAAQQIVSDLVADITDNRDLLLYLEGKSKEKESK